LLLALVAGGGLCAQGTPAVPAAQRTELWIPPPKPADVPPVADSAAIADRADAVPTDRTVTSSDADRPVPPSWDMVLHDEQDGARWVLGRNYKFCLTPDDATFIPFFGSEAPRNFPLTLRLTSLRRGEQELAIAAKTTSRRGDQLWVDRAAVREVYDVAMDHVAQSFVVEGHGGSGDLVVEQSVTSELVGERSAAGIAFRGEHGVVTYSGALAFDASGRRIDLPIALAGARIRIVVPAAFMVDAEWPVTIDPIVSNGTIASAPSIDLEPDVAADLNTTVISWQRVWSSTDHDCFLHRSFNNIVSTIDFTSENWREVKVGCHSHTALVVGIVGQPWSQRVVKGRITEGNGTVWAPFVIADSSLGHAISCDVGADDSFRFCVVWEREVTASDHDILFRMVTGSGSFSTAPLAVDNSIGSLDQRPRIAGSSGRAGTTAQFWPVVWQRRFSSVDEDIRGAVINTDGILLRPSFSIDSSGANDTNPAVSTPGRDDMGARQWMVCHERQMPFGGRDVHGHVFAGTSAISGIRNLSQMADAAMANSSDQVLPAVECDGMRFVVAYVERDPIATTGPNRIFFTSLVMQSTLVVREARTLLVPSTSDPIHTRPQLAVDTGGGRRVFCAYETVSFTPSDRNVFTATFNADFGPTPFAVPACYPLSLPWTLSINFATIPTGTTTPVSAGSTFIVRVDGLPGWGQFLFVGPAVSFPIPFCASCFWWVDPSAATITAGNQTSVSIPLNPGLVGSTLAFQMLQSGPWFECPGQLLHLSAAAFLPIN
jgi:hypothetical protein